MKASVVTPPTPRPNEVAYILDSGAVFMKLYNPRNQGYEIIILYTTDSFFSVTSYDTWADVKNRNPGGRVVLDNEKLILDFGAK